MILLSRTVTRLLLAGLLGIFLFVSARPCAAVGPRSSAIDAFIVDPAALSFSNVSLLDQGSGQQCLNFEIATQWFRLTAPETDRITRSIVGQAKALISQVQRGQENQRVWVQSNLDLLVWQSQSTFEWLVATCLPSQPSTDAADVGLVADDRLPVVRESAETKYWNYYGDCERWDVELTRWAQQPHPHNAVDQEVASKVQTEKPALSPAVENQKTQDQKFYTASEVLNRTSTWLGQALRSIEFAAIESPISSGERFSNRSH